MRKKKLNRLPATNEKKLKWVTRMSKLLDEEFSIGGFKFGIDPLLNLIPVAGDIASYAMSVILVLTMIQYGVSGKVAAKMIGNITLDALIGAIPFLGWIFDFGYKANKRNTELLKKYYVEGKNTGSAWPYVIAILVIAFLLLICIFWISYFFLKWVLSGLEYFFQ